MKRLLSMILALLILVSMVSFGAMPAQAASNMKASQDMVDVLKIFEGFEAKPYWDSKQYSVGYGTRPLSDADLERYFKEGISKEEAEQLLYHYLDKMGAELNEFADKYGITFTQGQFDCLLSLSYNCGTGWLYEKSTLRTAIIERKTGNELLFAIGQWSTSGGVTSRPHVRRRLIECNMYLNGVYANQVPDNFRYVVYNNNGGSAEIKVQCFDSNIPVGPYSVPEMEGYTFAGWYTDPTGGQKVTELTALSGNPTIYAHWTKDSGSGTTQPETTQPTTPPAGTKVTVTGTDVNLRSGPGTTYGLAGKADKGDILYVTETKQGGSYLWGKTSQGWIALKYTDYSGEASQPPVTTPAPTTPAPTTPAPTTPAPTTLAPTTPAPTIPAPTTPAPTTPAPTTPAPTTPAPTTPAPTTPAPTTPVPTTPKPTQPEVSDPTGTQVTVTATDVNLRSGAGTGYAVVGKADRGDKLTVTETKQAGSYLWGKTSKGWIALKYTSYSKAPETGKDEPVTPPAQTQQPVAGSTGVTTADSLNIRKGAGTGYARVGAYPMGSKITILETKMVGASTWGRTDKGWISLNYVKLDPVKEDTKPDNTKPEETKPEETKPEDTKPSQPETTVPPTAPEKTMGTITGDALRIRSGAGITYSVKGFLNKGDRVEILETKTVGTMTWGKTDKGWISMDYVKLDQAPVTQAKTGKVKDGVSLRVRSGPNDSYAITGFIAGGTAVTVTETKQVGNTLWGKVDNGWVNMDFIVLDGAVEEKPEASVIRGTVTATSLRIRQNAGLTGKIVGSLPMGTKVEILQTRKVGDMTWGQTTQGWISMDYVKVTN